MRGSATSLNCPELENKIFPDIVFAYALIRNIATIITALWAWWRNNSFTQNAIKADGYLKQLKSVSELKASGTLSADVKVVTQLIEDNEKLRQQVVQLSTEKQDLQKACDNQNILINNLKEQTKILKLGNALTQKGDSAEIKLKINQIIRGIDKSLALLTKVD